MKQRMDLLSPSKTMELVSPLRTRKKYSGADLEKIPVWVFSSPGRSSLSPESVFLKPENTCRAHGLTSLYQKVHTGFHCLKSTMENTGRDPDLCSGFSIRLLSDSFYLLQFGGIHAGSAGFPKTKFCMSLKYLFCLSQDWRISPERCVNNL